MIPTILERQKNYLSDDFIVKVDNNQYSADWIFGKSALCSVPIKVTFTSTSQKDLKAGQYLETDISLPSKFGKVT